MGQHEHVVFRGGSLSSEASPKRLLFAVILRKQWVAPGLIFYLEEVLRGRMIVGPAYRLHDVNILVLAVMSRLTDSRDIL